MDSLDQETPSSVYSVPSTPSRREITPTSMNPELNWSPSPVQGSPESFVSPSLSPDFGSLSPESVAPSMSPSLSPESPESFVPMDSLHEDDLQVSPGYVPTPSPSPLAESISPNYTTDADDSASEFNFSPNSFESPSVNESYDSIATAQADDDENMIDGGRRRRRQKSKKRRQQKSKKSNRKTRKQVKKQTRKHLRGGKRTARR